MSVESQTCIRCYFNGRKKATASVKVKYGDTAWVLDLCASHASEFDDAMWAWLRLAREDAVASAFAGAGQSERLRDAKAERPVLPEKFTAAPQSAPKPGLDVATIWAKWQFSDHALERLDERGRIYGFDLADVLMAAEYPEVSAPSKSDPTLTVQRRGPIKVVVNRAMLSIVTVASPDSGEARISA